MPTAFLLKPLTPRNTPYPSDLPTPSPTRGEGISRDFIHHPRIRAHNCSDSHGAVELYGRAAIGRDRGALKHTIALLFALAILADRASLAPWPVRVLVLAILRHGERVARPLLAEAGHPAAQPKMALSDMVAGSSPADAMALALSLRLLALALLGLLTPTCGTHRVCAMSDRPAAKPAAPADRLPPSTRHLSRAIRAPPGACVWRSPSGVP